jgi:hypothetical protein
MCSQRAVKQSEAKSASRATDGDEKAERRRANASDVNGVLDEMWGWSAGNSGECQREETAIGNEPKMEVRRASERSQRDGLLRQRTSLSTCAGSTDEKDGEFKRDSRIEGRRSSVVVSNS